MAVYTYTLSSFSNGTAIDKLRDEVQASSISAQLDSIDKNTEHVQFTFSTDLDSTDQTTLNSIVAAHDGIAYTVQETVTGPIGRFRLFDDFDGRMINDRLWNRWTSGSGSSVNTRSGSYPSGVLRLRAGGQDGRSSGFDQNDRRIVDPADFVLTARARIEHIDYSYCEIGLYRNANPDEYLRFHRWRDDNWQAHAGPDSGGVDVDTGKIPDTEWHTFRIIGSTGKTEFYIDNELVATITTGLPTETMEIAFYQENNGSGSARDFYLDFLEVTGSRPK